MQEEVTQKTIALSMKTGKLTAQALQAALKKYLQHRAKGPKLHHGKQSLKQLKAHGAALTNIEVTEANVGAFKPCAKKYGVDFTLRKDKTTQPPHYIVIFKAKDADNLSRNACGAQGACPVHTPQRYVRCWLPPGATAAQAPRSLPWRWFWPLL